jgi:hypothetical protein
VPGEHKIINKVDRCATREALADQPAIADCGVISVGDKVSLGSSPNEHRWHAELDGNRAAKGPGALIARCDGVTRWYRARELIDNEGEVGRSSQNALEVSEAGAVRPSRSLISNSSATQRITMSEIVGGSMILSCSDTARPPPFRAVTPLAVSATVAAMAVAYRTAHRPSLYSRSI